LLKNSNFFGRDSYNIINFFAKFYSKNKNSTYEFTLKEGPKVKMKIVWWTKSWRIFLEGLKRKVDIFIGIINIFNPNNFHFEDRLVLMLYRVSVFGIKI